MFAMLAQMLVLRELLIVFFGNEITIGLTLAGWLVLTGCGSGLFGLAQRRMDAHRLARGIAALLVWLALFLPVDVFFIRAAPWLLRVPFGEQAAPGLIVIFIAVALAPVCLPVGALFPAVCRHASRGCPDADAGMVGGIYAADALGGVCAGLLFYLALVNLPGGLTAAFWAGGCGLMGAWLAAPRRRARRICLGLLCLFCLLGINYRRLAPLEWAGIQWRWRSFGVLSAGANAAGANRLLASADSRYRNLALFTSSGQKTLYVNGQVAFVFPDPVSAEFKIHVIMAQMPRAGRVLLLGGSPPDDVPELLKYPLKRLVCLEQDKAQTMLLQRFAPQARHAAADKRVSFIAADGPRFVRQCREKFDVVIIGAPEPDTIAANRFYTAEFYRDVRRILAPAGFVYTALETSEHLRGDALWLAASVDAALRSVFDKVLVTPGGRSRFFAGGPDCAITLEAEELRRRSRAAEIDCAYFNPDWLLGAEELAPDKAAQVRERLSRSSTPANTAFQPVSTLMVLTRWLRISGLPSERWVPRLQGVKLPWIAAALVGSGVLSLLWAWWRPQRRPAGRRRAGLRRRAYNSRLGFVVVSTGFCELALELTLVFVFQNVFGNIYAGLAMIMTVFMGGLAAGALLSAGVLAGNPMGRPGGLAGLRAEADALPGLAAGAAPDRIWQCCLGAELVLLAAACLVAPAMAWLLTVAGLPAGAAGVVYVLVGVTGLAAGAQFPLVCRLWRRADGEGASIPWINALDLTGAALGGVAPGILLLPVFGIAGAMILLAALKAVGVFCVVGAWLIARQGRENDGGMMHGNQAGD